LAKQSGAEPIVAKLDQILNMPGDNPERNNIGPVGVYQRDTVSAREGYASLKKWEATGDNRCRCGDHGRLRPGRRLHGIRALQG